MKKTKQPKLSLMAVLNIKDSELNSVPYMSVTVTKVSRNPVVYGKGVFGP